MSDAAQASKQYLARITTQAGNTFLAVMTAPDMPAAFNAARIIWPDATGLLVEPFTGLPEAPQPEPVAEPEPEPKPESLDDQIQHWCDRLHEIGEEAKQQGFTTVSMVVGHDPLSDRELMASGYSGSYYAAVGALQCKLAEWIQGDD